MGAQLVAPKRPAFQFYPADWRKDPALRVCSIAARGLWIDAMCIMHEADPYGHLIVGGKPVSVSDLARMVGEPTATVRRLLKEIEDRGVSSRNSDGILYSRRMVRDEHNRNARAAGGAKSLDNPNVPQPKPRSSIDEGASKGQGERIPSDDPLPPSSGVSPSSSASVSSSVSSAVPSPTGEAENVSDTEIISKHGPPADSDPLVACATHNSNTNSGDPGVFAPAVVVWLSTFYGGSSTDRQVDVQRQLRQTLTPAGARFQTGAVRAVDMDHLAECCEGVTKNPPRDPNAAIVWVLKKLNETYCEVHSARLKQAPPFAPEVRSLVESIGRPLQKTA